LACEAPIATWPVAAMVEKMFCSDYPRGSLTASGSGGFRLWRAPGSAGFGGCVSVCPPWLPGIVAAPSNATIAAPPPDSLRSNSAGRPAADESAVRSLSAAAPGSRPAGQSLPPATLLISGWRVGFSGGPTGGDDSQKLLPRRGSYSPPGRKPPAQLRINTLTQKGPTFRLFGASELKTMQVLVTDVIFSINP